MTVVSGFNRGTIVLRERADDRVRNGQYDDVRRGQRLSFDVTDSPRSASLALPIGLLDQQEPVIRFPQIIRYPAAHLAARAKNRDLKSSSQLRAPLQSN